MLPTEQVEYFKNISFNLYIERNMLNEKNNFKTIESLLKIGLKIKTMIK